MIKPSNLVASFMSRWDTLLIPLCDLTFKYTFELSFSFNFRTHLNVVGVPAPLDVEVGVRGDGEHAAPPVHHEVVLSAGVDLEPVVKWSHVFGYSNTRSMVYKRHLIIDNYSCFRSFTTG